MEAQYIGMLVLFGLSAILPGIGLWSVWRTRRAGERVYASVPRIPGDEDTPSWEHFELLVKMQDASMNAAHSTRDFLLIGGGLLAGTVASVWAVLDTASM